jgi:hypothetical protein
MVQEGVRYTDELPQLHAEVKRDVHWIGSIHAQADRVCARAVRLTTVVKAARGYGAVPPASRCCCMHTSDVPALAWHSLAASAAPLNPDACAPVATPPPCAGMR